MARNNLDTVLGIVFIVIGILMLLGYTGVQAIFPWLGIALIVVGILILMEKFPGGTLFGVVALVIGILLVAGFLEKSIPDVIWKSLRIVNIALGVVLIFLGIRRLK